MTLIIQSLVIIVCLGFAGLPARQFMDWLFKKSTDIKQQMDAPALGVRLSKSNLKVGLIEGIGFAKGAIISAVGQFYFQNDLVLMSLCLGTILLHYASPFSKLRPNTHYWAMFWGFYCLMNLHFIWIFPVVYWLATLLTNSLNVGFLVAILVMFGPIWVLDLSTVFYLQNLVLFLGVFLTRLQALFSHFEAEPITLMVSFNHR